MFDLLILLHNSVQRGGGDQVLGAQPVPSWSRDPGRVCSRLSSGARVPFLDAQPQCGQVLAEEVRSWKGTIVQGFKLWSEIMWRHWLVAHITMRDHFMSYSY